ncbi:MAG: colanic acid biosynthesis glycosyltransferase WcaL, partial [Deltaproteobacteria bacterium HGW-Deltaproteobacteria-21]
ETKANRAHLTRYSAGNIDKLRVTYNGVPLGNVRSSPAPMVPPYRLLSIGRFVPTKGFDILIRACGILAHSGLDFHLTLVGDGSRMALLKRLVRRLELGDSVSFPGFVTHDRVTRYFLEADLFVMPCVVDSTGNRDGLPTVILEALLHRLPVIATKVSGIPEIIEDGVTGILVAPGDIRAMADAIRFMTENRARALLMAERGLERVREEFDPLKNHQGLLRIYEEVLRNAVAPERRLL